MNGRDMLGLDDVVMTINGEVVGTAKSVQATVSREMGSMPYVGQRPVSIEGIMNVTSINTGALFGPSMRCDIVAERTQGLRKPRSKKKRILKKWRKRDLIERRVYRNVRVKI